MAADQTNVRNVLFGLHVDGESWDDADGTGKRNGGWAGAGWKSWAASPGPEREKRSRQMSTEDKQSRPTGVSQVKRIRSGGLFQSTY